MGYGGVTAPKKAGQCNNANANALSQTFSYRSPTFYSAVHKKLEI